MTTRNPAKNPPSPSPHLGRQALRRPSSQGPQGRPGALRHRRRGLCQVPVQGNARRLLRPHPHPPTTIEHTRQGFENAIAELRQAITTHDLRDVIIAIDQGLRARA